MSEAKPELNVPPAKKMKLESEEQCELINTIREEVSKKDADSSNQSKYSNFVTPEEMDKLREFQVLDEVKSNDEDSNDDSDSSDGKSEVPEDEIEKMLEEDLPDGFKGAPQPKKKPYITRQKIVLEEKGVNHWEVLPLDWMMVRHYSGMPVYMHRATRVCTLSKPYFLGKSNTRRHDIPISAIPCLSYRRALEEEKKQQEIDRKVEEQIKNGTWVKNLQTKPQASAENQNDKAVNDTDNDVLIKNIAKIVGKCPFSNSKIDENGLSNKCEAIKDDVTKVKTDSLNECNPDAVVGSSSGEGEANDSKTKGTGAYEDTAANIETSAIEGDVSEPTEKVEVEIPKGRLPVVLPGGLVMAAPKVETINNSWKTQHLSHEQLNDYCKKLFKFKTVNIMHFNRWADRRKYTKARKTLQYPTLPDGTMLITIPARAGGPDNGGKPAKRDWVMNMDGRSYLSVFHEYVRRALQKQPVYEFLQLENAATPYQATVYIGGMQYGVGHGSSKRQAKSAAARASIHILIPEMKDEKDAPAGSEPDFSFFDYVGIEDPRIAEFCAATCEPSPHAILRTCLLRNFGASDRHIQADMKKLEFQKIELTMKVGKHSATVVCKNKKTAKQRASQAILQALHPHVVSWGSLLRLYGSRSVKSCKEKKLEEQQITLLQDKARHNQPNRAVLDKLRRDMLRLRQRDHALLPKGTLVLGAALPLHSGSNLNNVEL